MAKPPTEGTPSLILLGLSSKQQRRAAKTNPHLRHVTYAVLAGHYGQTFGSAKQCKQLFKLWKTDYGHLFGATLSSNAYPVHDYQDTSNLDQVLAEASGDRPAGPSTAPARARPVSTVQGGQKCRDCGWAVSSSAKACPNCGARDPSTTTGQKFMAFVMLIVIVGIVWVACFDGTVPDFGGEPTTTRVPSNAQELAEKCFSGWDGNHREFVQLVKDQLHDPASMDVHGTYFNANDSLDDGTIRIRMDYSAANQLGGKTRANALADMTRSCAVKVVQYE